MLAGKSVAIAIENPQSRVSEHQSTRSFEYARAKPETAGWTNRGITIMRLGEGFWRNGGWLLEGGLLAQAVDGSSTFELYGKAVVRRFPFVPFPFHRERPHETGYEFFLLHRGPGVPHATIVGQWVCPPDEVVVKRESTGGTYEDVRGMLRYDPDTRTAMVTITGLKRPIEERVDLSLALDSARP